MAWYFQEHLSNVGHEASEVSSTYFYEREGEATKLPLPSFFTACLHTGTTERVPEGAIGYSMSYFYLMFVAVADRKPVFLGVGVGVAVVGTGPTEAPHTTPQFARTEMRSSSFDASE